MFMLYFSELQKKRVQTEDGIFLGYLEDLVFQASQTPRITKIVIRTKEEKLIISVSEIKKINSIVTIAKNFNTAELVVNELFIFKNVLDKQIIDLKGNKVVRVNDVVINDKPFLSISGVDIGAIGLIRRLGFEGFFYRLTNLLSIKYNLQFLSWGDIQPLELSKGKVVLNQIQEKLKNLHPADLADYLEKTNIRNISKFIDLLDKDLASKVLSELNPNFQLSLFRRLGEEKTDKLIANMDIDEATDIISQLSPKKRLQILNKVDPAKKKQIEKLLKLSSTSIGKYLSTEFITVKSENTASFVIDQIRKETSDIEVLDYVYVVNYQNQLVGVFNLHELLLQAPDTLVYKFMAQNFFVAHLQSPIMTIIRKLIKYHLYALPVVDSEKKIIGIVKIDDISEYLLDSNKI